MKKNKPDIIIIGGGAAGFFAAINYAEANPDAQVIILERGKDVLNKVRISGGGRCNLTHACFDARTLTSYYPRGNKALLGPFHRFACSDTIAWFEARGVATKTEADGRMFPLSNTSQSIIDCLQEAAKKAGVKIWTQQNVINIATPTKEQPQFALKIKHSKILYADKLLVASGSNARVWDILATLGHTIVPPVPSLFTFNTKDTRLRNLAGISVPNAIVSIKNSKFKETGPLLITHWGMSGPAILKLSAFGARTLADLKYRFELQVNWIGDSSQELSKQLQAKRKRAANKLVTKVKLAPLPNRLWQSLVKAAQISETARYGDLSKQQQQQLLKELCAGSYAINGKSTFKEEFVTAGGVKLKEINFKTFESKLHPNLFFAGEVLDIDAVTGGFNFQAAWTGGYLAALGMLGN